MVSLSLSRWGQGLDNEGVSNFAEMEDYNVEAK